MANLSSIIPPVSVSTASGTLGAANGGTGLTSPGASGNVLTSDGSGWVSTPSVVRYPQNIQSSNYTLALSDAGKHIYSLNTGSQTLTIPTNSSVAFPVGTVVKCVNNGSSNILLDFTGITVFLSGRSTPLPSSSTLSTKGEFEILKVDTNTWWMTSATVVPPLTSYRWRRRWRSAFRNHGAYPRNHVYHNGRGWRRFACLKRYWQ